MMFHLVNTIDIVTQRDYKGKNPGQKKTLHLRRVFLLTHKNF